MATYYVSTTTGSDSNNGTSAATAWATLGKAFGNGAVTTGIADFTVANTVYVAPGSYRQTITMTGSTASGITATQTFVADVDASHFPSLTPGDVIWTGYTTDDSTAPATGALFGLAGRDNLAFQKFVFMGCSGTPSVLDSTTTAGATNITFTDCTLIGLSRIWTHTGVVDQASHWLFDRCRLIYLNSSVCSLTFPTSTTADYDVDVVFRNCAVSGAPGSSATIFNVATSGANSFKPGGVLIDNCTILAGTAGSVVAVGASCSTSIPCRVRNSVIYGGGGTCLNGGAAGVLVENDNSLNGSTLRNANVSTGANSDSASWARAPLFEFGQAEQNGRVARPFFTPAANSTLLGRGSDAGVSLSVDLLNRIRPAGGGSTSNAWGALERHDTAQVGANLGADAGGYTELIGPGDQEYLVWCGAQATTISVKVKWDANYGNTNKPQLIRVANAAIGVTADTQTAVGTAGSAYETLSTTFTPTAAGLVRVRLINRGAAGNGILAVDTFAVS